MRKIISTMLAITMIASTGISVLAEEPLPKRKVIVTEDNLISFFDPYVEPNGAGSFTFAATSAIPLTTMKLVSNKVHHLLNTSYRGIVVNRWNIIIGTTVNPQ